jgi:hypothetical protein
MCWFTLTPAKSKKHPEHRSSDSSCAEQLVRVHSSPNRPRFTDVKVKLPSSVSMDMSEHHHRHPHLHLDHHHRHHLHPHLHPLHLHPIHGHHHHHDTSFSLHGHGKRRCTPPPGPPPTRDSSTCRPQPRPRSPSSHQPREPIYRTQIVEPGEVRETTRVALRTSHTDRQRGRLRRVAGYEVLGNQVPFDWDCISSTVGSSKGGGRWVRKKAKTSGLKYPPFASMDQWM